MIKWKAKHRQDNVTQSSSSFSPPDDVHEPSRDVLDSSSHYHRPLSFVDLGSDIDVSPQTTSKQSSRLSGLLITNDIEALLLEDERARAQDRQEQEAREAKFGSVDVAVALTGDPSSVVRGLPAPPRKTHLPRTYRFQSGHQAPMLSGRPSELMKDRSSDVRRSSTGCAASPTSVSSRSSIKGVPPEAQITDGMDAYMMYRRSSADTTKLANHLAEFGPKSPRRSSAGSIRDSWGAVSRFSASVDKPLPFNSTGTSASADASRSLVQLPSRPWPLLSQAPLSSRESIYSTCSSIDPQSTIHEPRISVSSTIYPASTYNELPSPVAAPMEPDQLGVGNRSSLFYSEADSVAVEDQGVPQQSNLDTSAHAPAEHERSVPQHTPLASPVGVYPIRNKPIDSSDYNLPPRRPLSSSSELSGRSASGQKPALPTTPKPDFRRSRSVQPPSKTPMISKPPSPSSSPKLPGLVPYHLLTSSSADSSRNESLPPTTNYLNPQERAELVRKTRKLTQLFGQTPSPTSGAEDLVGSPVLTNCLLPVMPSRKAHARAAMSISDPMNMSLVTKSLRESQFPTLSAERTTSLSPIRFRSQGNDSDDSLSPFDSPDAVTPRSSRKKSGDAAIRSPTIINASDSFIEMVDRESPNLIRFSSTYSYTESMTDEQQAEEERRRKREKLAKLHRFLGSRVPTELVLGPDIGAPLPPIAPDLLQQDPATVSDGEATSATRLWMRGKRRNSLASSKPSERLPDSERVKEELSEKEKAIVVKRALKMEKLFGEQPPQDLFHSAQTRPANRAVGKHMMQTKIAARSAPSSPVGGGGNMNKSAYRKDKSKRSNRPGTAESSKRLLSSGETESIQDGQSDVYYHYRNSLVSLTNIVDNDDRKSLVELHEYINEDLSMGNRDRRESHSGSSILSERRRSLPLRASYTSLASEYTISEVKTEVTPFEVRRRRAAKLSHFFGVSYRDLFGEVLDSLEMSVREDEGKGTLNADEAKDLLVQLTKLKARRDELS